MGERLFLTGVTGYVGSSLLQAWLATTDDHVTVLVRPRRGTAPRERLATLLAELLPASDVPALEARLDVVEGDVAAERLGLDRAGWDTLAARTTKIVHCAAAARFDLELDAARAVNVEGTRNVLALASACRGLRTLDYVGTAYVAGRRTGLVREDELDVGQEHRNTYERSKMEAEQLVRSRWGDLPIAILRPSIVICDSRTGRASEYNGFYRALRLYHLGLAPAFPGEAGCPIDLVPVDHVTRVLIAVSALPESRGRCYHVTAGPGNTTTLAEIRDLAALHLGRPPFAIVPPALFAARTEAAADRLSEEGRRALDELRLYAPYLATELVFDDTNTRRDTGLVAPRVADYFAAMARTILEPG